MLIFYTICIQGNMENIQTRGIFFVAFIGAMKENYTIYYFCKGWVGFDVKFWASARRGGGGELPKSNKCEEGGG